MHTLAPPWPRSLPRNFTPRARLTPDAFAELPPAGRPDAFACYRAHRLRAIADAVRATGMGMTYDETFFTNEADHTTLASWTAEASMLAGTNKQPIVPAEHFLQKGGAFRGLCVHARGLLSTTGTPTLIFQVRAGETAGSTYLSGTSLGVSAAITTASGVTNKWWELRLDLICTVRGIGTNNATLAGSGYVMSPGGFASPFVYALEPSTPDTATWTATFNAAVTQYLNLSATCSASSASNTLTLKYLRVSAFG